MSDSTSLPYLSADALEALHISTEEVVQSIEHLIHGLERERVWNAPKSVVIPPDGRYMMATLSAADDPPFLAVKSLVLHPSVVDRN